MSTSKPFKEDMTIMVRPMNEKDAPRVAQIWRDGLAQTAESHHNIFLKPIMAYSIEKYGDNAMKVNGDVGPEGSNLINAWLSKDDRTMLVACINADECIAGCVGVKVGKDMTKEEPGSTVASVWRMSVEEKSRRKGVGLALMNAAEEWARRKHCSTMLLETTNKIAAHFYTIKAGYQEEPFPKEISLFLYYSGIVKMYRKKLE